MFNKVLNFLSSGIPSIVEIKAWNLSTVNDEKPLPKSSNLLSANATKQKRFRTLNNIKLSISNE